MASQFYILCKLFGVSIEGMFAARGGCENPGGAEVKLIGKKQLHAHVAFLVEQHRVEVDESEIFSLVTVALHLAIDGLDHIPAVAFVRRFLNRGVVDKRVGQPFAGDLQELLGSADDRPAGSPPPTSLLPQ